MSISLGDVFLYLKGDDSQLNQTLDKAEGKAKGWSSKVGGFLTGAFQFAAGGLIQTGINGVMSAVSGVTDSMIGGNAAFEGYEQKFTVLLGSADEAKKRLAALAEFGAKTPFELPQVVEADTILQGFGLHSAEAAQKFGFSGEEIRTIAGDVASGTGASFQEMALLVGKFSSGATGEAISRMQELGITNRDELAKMGLEFSKSGELLSPLPESMEVVLGLMQEKYGGLMDAQSTTFSGMMSNLTDWMAGAGRELGKPIFDTLKNGLTNLLTVLNSEGAKSSISTLASLLASGLGTAINWLVTTGIPGMVSGLQMAQVGWATIQPYLAQVGAILDRFVTVILPPLAMAWQTLVQVWQAEVQPALAELWATIGELLAELGLSTEKTDFWKLTLDLLKTALNGVVIMVRMLTPAIKLGANILVFMINQVKASIDNFIKFKQGVMGVITSITQLIEKIKGLAAEFLNMVIPDWLTPGSPTPFETGLRGITSAINSMPELNIGANVTGNTLTAGAGGGTSVGNVSISVNGGGDPNATAQAVRRELESLFNRARR